MDDFMSVLANGVERLQCMSCKRLFVTRSEAVDHDCIAPVRPEVYMRSAEDEREIREHREREQQRAAWRESKQQLRRRVFAPRPCANPECVSPFTPTRSGQRFCQARCRDRVKYLRRATLHS